MSGRLRSKGGREGGTREEETKEGGRRLMKTRMQIDADADRCRRKGRGSVRVQAVSGKLSVLYVLCTVYVRLERKEDRERETETREARGKERQDRRVRIRNRTQVSQSCRLLAWSYRSLARSCLLCPPEPSESPL